MKNDKPEFGDDRFKEFMNKFMNPEEGDSLGQILSAIKFKIKSISELYSKTLDTYLVLKDGDPVKENLTKYIFQLIEQSLQTLDQFSYVLIDLEDGNNDDITNGEEKK